MPKKTIYVSDGDLALFERAQALAGGSLSAAIAQALAEYVRSADVARQHQYDSVTLSVGRAGSRRKKRFTAVCLARWQHATGDADSPEELVAYLTVGQRIALYRRSGPTCERSSGPGETTGSSAGSPTARAVPPGSVAEAEGLADDADGDLEVYDTADQLADHVPPEFARLVADAAAALEPEELDI
jgi:EXLDI family protein